MKRALEGILEDQRAVEAETLLRSQLEREERERELAERARAAKSAKAKTYRDWVDKFDEYGFVGLHGVVVEPPPVTPLQGAPPHPQPGDPRPAPTSLAQSLSNALCVSSPSLSHFSSLQEPRLRVLSVAIPLLFMC